MPAGVSDAADNTLSSDVDRSVAGRWLVSVKGYEVPFGPYEVAALANVFGNGSGGFLY